MASSQQLAIASWESGSEPPRPIGSPSSLLLTRLTTYARANHPAHVGIKLRRGRSFISKCLRPVGSQMLLRAFWACGREGGGGVQPLWQDRWTEGCLRQHQIPTFTWLTPWPPKDSSQVTVQCVNEHGTMRRRGTDVRAHTHTNTRRNTQIGRASCRERV